MLLRFSFLLIFSWCLAGSAFAQPTDNPYTARYPQAIGHWTDSLNWSRVWLATDHNIFPNDNLYDDAAAAIAMDSLSRNGGGVLYFEPGQYDFQVNFRIPNGVIVRGATPVGITDATVQGFSPPTRFEFPQYIFDPMANGGRGTANSTAFKRITTTTGRVSNAGIVNVNVNRAGISFRSDLGFPTGWAGTQPIAYTRNIIVMGTRTNNVADASSYVPDTTFQEAWQRHSYLFTNNIGVFVQRNAAVVNNRCNDIAGTGGQDDSFEMDGYVVKKWPFTGYDTLRAGKAIFNYTDHYGISVNRKAAVTAATPEQEPALFAEGIEIRDNWIYHTMRIGLTFSGLNAEVTGNVIRDKMQKVTWIHPLGLEVPKNANTFENRGIDVSGWGARVDNNDWVVYRHRINSGPFYSVDGEGLLFQSCCGGTTVNGYQVTNNTSNGTFISIFYSNDIHNVVVSGNNLGGPLQGGVQSGSIIWINADVSSTQFGYLNNVLVEGNYNINNNGGMGCIITGSKGGHNAIVRNNTVVNTPTTAPGPDLTISCHVQESGNQGFSNVRIQNNGGNPCGPPASLPLVAITNPSTDTTFCDSVLTQIPVTIQLTDADLTTATVDLYRGNSVIAPGLVPAPDGSISLLVDLPPGSGTTSFTAYVRQAGVTSISRSLRLLRNCPVNIVTDLSNTAGPVANWSMMPNPSSTEVRFMGLSANQTAKALVFNTMGQLVLSQSISPDQPLSVAGLGAGLYIVRVGGQQQRMVVLH